MPDIIQLLPDSVANQIAAGEVIQRPASVVKELMENSMDAGSSRITVIVKDAGKTLINIVDDGCGMSETDARLSFERHSTSKIQSAADLFAIRTMGFRGEALASIAAIAEVEMQTRRQEDEVGTHIEIKASEVVSQKPVSCKPGTTVKVKNLFYNVPARRKFLKTDSTELKHILTEFQRVALAQPETEFSFHHNNTEILHLPPANIRQRIMHLFGKNINQQLIETDTQTGVVNISGYIGKPGLAKKSPGEQFFFVNNRFMKHPYFNKAVQQAYEKILPPGSIPSYFIYFEADPSSIDINIHPTKTEIKFENERAIWQILNASVKQALGKFNVVPSIDFDTQGLIDIPVAGRDNELKPPDIPVNHDYNPFEQDSKYGGSTGYRKKEKERYDNWEQLYKDFHQDPEKGSSTPMEPEADTEKASQGELFDDSVCLPTLMQLKNRYILAPVKSGVMMIHQRRAHERILFEKYSEAAKSGSAVAQQNLYPVTIEFNSADFALMSGMLDDLANMGFDIRDFGRNTLVVYGSPAGSGKSDPAEVLERFLQEYKNSGTNIKEGAREKLALSLAKASAITEKALSREEMQEIIDKLFACNMPNFSPDGKPVISILSLDELEKKFR